LLSIGWEIKRQSGSLEPAGPISYSLFITARKSVLACWLVFLSIPG
jgi:hypothetical protein